MKYTRHYMFNLIIIVYVMTKIIVAEERLLFVYFQQVQKKNVFHQLKHESYVSLCSKSKTKMVFNYFRIKFPFRKWVYWRKKIFFSSDSFSSFFLFFFRCCWEKEKTGMKRREEQQNMCRKWIKEHTEQIKRRTSSNNEWRWNIILCSVSLHCFFYKKKNYLILFSLIFQHTNYHQFNMYITIWKWTRLDGV